jgi:hypothetical protein
VALEIRLLLERLYIMPIVPREDAPIHKRRVITGRIGAVFVELRRGPAQMGTMPPGKPSFREQTRRKLVGFEPTNVFRSEILERHLANRS